MTALIVAGYLLCGVLVLILALRIRACEHLAADIQAQIDAIKRERLGAAIAQDIKRAQRQRTLSAVVTLPQTHEPRH